ncbi:MAG: hypothetical protein AAB037_00435, partial [Chloroflexota bacterium]
MGHKLLRLLIALSLVVSLVSVAVPPALANHPVGFTIGLAVDDATGVANTGPVGEVVSATITLTNANATADTIN